MASESKSRPPMPKLKRKSGRSCGFWFVFGIVLGGFGVGVYLMVSPPIQAPVPSPVAAKGDTSRPAPVAPARFDFHDILPELEVVVSDNELTKPEVKHADEKKAEEKKPDEAKRPDPTKAETAKADTPKPAAEPGKSTYMIQIASLKTAADAERLKAELAMQGIQAKVQSVTINGKDTYHRVQAGPYQGTQTVNEVRAQLKAKGRDTLAIKLK
jgi:cell division septation protein DedD